MLSVYEVARLAKNFLPGILNKCCYFSDQFKIQDCFTEFGLAETLLTSFTELLYLKSPDRKVPLEVLNKCYEKKV